MVEKEIGFVGDITSINPRLLNTLVEGGYLPVVASVAADPKGQALNVNADIAAGEVRSVTETLQLQEAAGLVSACEVFSLISEGHVFALEASAAGVTLVEAA